VFKALIEFLQDPFRVDDLLVAGTVAVSLTIFRTIVFSEIGLFTAPQTDLKRRSLEPFDLVDHNHALDSLAGK